MPRKYSADDFVREFWRKVNMGGEDDCWEWKYGGRSDGYGCVKWNRRSERTHRVSYILANGNIPDNLKVLHKCDNRRCVNPAHLFLGTDKDNVIDKMNKGRGVFARGEQQGLSKLTKDDVVKIRAMYAEGIFSQRKIGVIFGVTQESISSVVNRKTWAHIT